MALCIPVFVKKTDSAFLAEGVNRGLDFEGALKKADDPQLVRFQGSPQVRHLHVL